jgi:hypothetical protein
MYVENIFSQPSRLVLRHPASASVSEYGDGFFCSVHFRLLKFNALRS